VGQPREGGPQCSRRDDGRRRVMGAFETGGDKITGWGFDIDMAKGNH